MEARYISEEFLHIITQAKKAALNTKRYKCACKDVQKPGNTDTDIDRYRYILGRYGIALITAQQRNYFIYCTCENG